MSREFPFVTISADKNKLRIRLKTSVADAIFTKKDKYLYLGGMKADNEEDWLIAREVAAEINDDIKHSKLNKELKYYLPANKLARSVGTDYEPSKPKINLRELYDAYMVDYRLQISGGTLKQYERFKKAIDKSCGDLSQQVELIKSFVKNTNASDLRRLCGLFSRLIEWGKLQKLIDLNYIDEIKLLKKHYYRPIPEKKDPKAITELDGYHKDRDYKGYLGSELKIVLQNFEFESLIKIFKNGSDPSIIHNVKIVCYLVKFKIWTGCRTGEALSFRWYDVDPNFKYIIFRHGHDYKERDIKDLKTRKKCQRETKARKFPCGEKLKKLLKKMHREFNITSDDKNEFVFAGYDGKPLSHAIYDRCWAGRQKTNGPWYPGMIYLLLEQKKITQYLDFYSTRHTWISTQLQAGIPIQNIAKLAGNSPEEIMRSYASYIPEGPQPIEP